MLLVAEHGATARLQGYLWVCTSLGLISYSAAFSHGGSFAACSDMRPKHIRAQPQNSRRNYITIHTNRSFYLPGETVPVTIRSTRDFMGFFLQAHRTSDDQVAGSFVYIPPGSILLRCFEDGDTVTHSDKSLKRNLSFVWKSPDHPVGDIKFFVSVVQSYFVYWARIESPIVSGYIHDKISEHQKSEASSMKVSSLTSTPLNPILHQDSKHSNLSAHTDKPSLGRVTGAKPPDLLFYSVTGKSKHALPAAALIPPQTFTPSTSNGLSTTVAGSSLQLHLSTAETIASQSRTSNHSIISWTTYALKRSVTPLCSSCQKERKILAPPKSTSPSYSYAWRTIPRLPRQETFPDHIKFSLISAQIHHIPPSTTKEQIHETTKELSANFLQQPESGASQRSIEIHTGNTSPWVTRSVQKFPGKEEENKGRGMQLAMTQLGILLGCSVVLGMALAAGLRCIHAQYCHKRTEVSFSEPDENVITLKENGEMRQFKKIRENSFVLVQAEYNWITPAGTVKTQ